MASPYLTMIFPASVGRTPREVRTLSLIHIYIYFSGDVQGVGFRYRSCYIAQSLGLTGWVENLWDGRVEMEVQGDENSIQQMLVQIQKQRWIEVNHMEIMEIPCVEAAVSYTHLLYKKSPFRYNRVVQSLS